MSSVSESPRFRPVLAGFAQRLIRHRRPAGIALLLAVCPAALFPVLAQAQNPGFQDIAFAPSINNVTAFALGVQADVFNTQRIVIGGDNRVLQRTLADGTNDSSFVQVSSFGGSDRTIYTLAFESTFPGTNIGTINSRIYIGGLFGQSSDPVTGKLLDNDQNITRLNADGTLDTSFNPGSGANKEVTAILPFPASAGGGVLIGGLFTRFNDEDHQNLVKLNSDGSVDTAYSANLKASDTVFALAAQIDPATGLPNGQVLVAGRFNRINKSEPAKLARLNSDGTLDTSFNPDFTTRVLTVAVQPDGKILAGGDFETVNGQRVNNIVRLNQDGTTDTTFAAEATGNVNPANAPPTAVNVIRFVPDGTGRILLGGNFLKVNGVRRVNLARLEADGTLDAAGFDPGELLQNRVQSIVVQKDNKVVAAETRINRSSDSSPYPNVVVRFFGGPVPTPVVSIAATVKRARKGARIPAGRGRTAGQFEIFRSEPLSDDVKVFYTRSGSARYPKDYTLLDDSTLANTEPTLVPESITIPAYTSSVLIDVLPKRRSPQGVPRRNATLNLNANSAYERGASASATVKILPPVPIVLP